MIRYGIERSMADPRNSPARRLDALRPASRDDVKSPAPGRPARPGSCGRCPWIGEEKAQLARAAAWLRE